MTLSRHNRNTFYRADGPTFLVDGYSPIAMQSELTRWSTAHGKPAQVSTPPAGSVDIQPPDHLIVAGVTLHGFVVDGLIWGGEAMWQDDTGRLAALVSTGAEFDHFEAVRDDLQRRWARLSSSGEERPTCARTYCVGGQKTCREASRHRQSYTH